MTTPLAPRSVVMRSGRKVLAEIGDRMLPGVVPTGKLVMAPKVPSPLPSRIETSPVFSLAMARSGLPSRLKSAGGDGVDKASAVLTVGLVPAVKLPLP